MINFLALSLLILSANTKVSLSDVQVLQECEQEAQGKEWFDDDNCVKHTCTSGFVIDSECPKVTNIKETCFINLYPGGSYPNCCPKLVCDDDDQMSTPEEEEFEASTPEEKEFEASTPEEEEFEASTPEEEEFEVSTPEEEIELFTSEEVESGSGSGAGSESGSGLGGDYPDMENGDDDETTFGWTDPVEITVNPNFYEVETGNSNFFEVDNGKGGEDVDEGLKINLMGDVDGQKFGIEVEGDGMGSEEQMLVELLHFFDGKTFEVEIEKHREKKKKDMLMSILHKFSGKNFGVEVEKSSNTV